MDAVYKYCDPRGGLAILETLELKITPPDQFNDPFEFTPHVVSSYPERDIKRVLKNKNELREMYEEDKRDGSFQGNFRQFREHMREKRSRLIALLSKTSSKTNAQLQNVFLKATSSRVGVLCLTDKPDSIVMWGHYCNKHQGIVIGFDRSWPLFHEKLGLQAVRYVEERVRWDTSRTMGQEMTADLIFSKNKEWEYENEQRQLFRLSSLKQRKITDRDTGKQFTGYYQPVPPEYVTSVCLGAKASSTLDAAVREILKKSRLAHVKLQRARLHESKYTLELR